MINKIEVASYGPIINLKWENLSNINLIIGKNSTGKTYLLKMIYSAIKTIEEYKRGDDIRTASEILAERLRWIYQVDSIGDLVGKDGENNLSFSLAYNDKYFHYSFGKDTTKKITSLENHTDKRDSNSIFLPAKEVLSLHKIILKSREQDKVFGFDDTYLDLARALGNAPKLGRNYQHFSEARKKLSEVIEGKIVFDSKKDKWFFKKGKKKFSIGVTAEGIKKISILDTLLSNRYLDNESIIFIDEPEAALHPKAISSLIDIIYILSKCGIQFFIATHSYFVIKKLFILAQKEKSSIPTLTFGETTNTEDLLQGMPENSIIDESIKLYEEEIEESLK